MPTNQPTDLELPVGLFVRLRPWLGILVLVIATFVVYAPSLQGDFLWGDDLYVTENDALRAEGGLRRIWFNPKAFPRYEPIVQTTLWIQYQVHGLHPVPFRAFNLFLHILNGLLLLALLRHLKVPGAWLAVALFLLHPIQAESVAWMARRHILMSSAFYLGALYLFCRAYLPPSREENEPPRQQGVFAALFAGGALLFAMAFLSDTVAWSLPVVLFLVLWWKRFVFNGKAAMEIAALFVAGMIAGLMVTSWSGAAAAGAAADWHLSFIEQILLLGRAFWFYAVKLLVPVRYSFVYPTWNIEMSGVMVWLFAAMLLAIGLPAVFQYRWGRGPLVAVLLYGMALLPSAMALRGDPLRLSFVADHIPYFAGIGLLVLFSSALAAVAEHIVETLFEREQNFSRFVIGSLALPFLGLLSMGTWQRAHVYINEIALWRDTLAKNPAAWVAYDHLAIALYRDGRLEEGEELMRRAVAEYPEYENGLYKLAWLLEAREQYREAAEQYARVLGANPNHVRALIRSGEVLMRLGRVREAEEHWQTALHIDPDSVEARRNMGNYHLARGRLDRAARYYAEALAIDPDENRVRFRLGIVRYRQEQYTEAEAIFEEAVRREPGHADAWNNRGLCLSRMEQHREALASYERAVSIRPSFVRAWHNRGVTLERLGYYGEAEDSYRRALHLDADFEPARRRLIELEVTRVLR